MVVLSWPRDYGAAVGTRMVAEWDLGGWIRNRLIVQTIKLP